MSTDWVSRATDLRPSVSSLVGDAWLEGSGTAFSKFGPRDGQLLSQFAGVSAEELERTVRTAREAFDDGRWSNLSVQSRKRTLTNLADLIEKNLSELALLECLDVGKPIRSALDFDVPEAAATIRYCAEAADKLHSKVFAADQSSFSYQLRRPRGVMGGIIGWNFPLLLAAAKVGPALATGNCIILKPSEITPFSATKLAALALEAGVPEGVLNVVHGGASVGESLVRHSGVDLVTFTGSTATGRAMLRALGESSMKPMILECGGKAPNIVFDDCPNLDAVADAVIARAFWNQGQVCTASSRLLIQRAIMQPLLDRIVQRAANLPLGDPLHEDTRFGALVSRGHRDKVLGYISESVKSGIETAYRSDRPAPNKTGFYVAPTIFSPVSTHHRIAQEEIFGPVLSVIPFDSEADAVAIANGTMYGLSAIVWTKSMSRAQRIANQIKAGLVTINAVESPLGGPASGVLSVEGHGQSGLGIEGGIDGMESYLSKTAVQMFF